jgi:nucleoside-diphosphate-sugar epimerase
MVRVLATGAAGFLGPHVALWLRHEGHSVYNLMLGPLRTAMALRRDVTHLDDLLGATRDV